MSDVWYQYGIKRRAGDSLYWSRLTPITNPAVLTGMSIVSTEGTILSLRLPYPSELSGDAYHYPLFWTAGGQAVFLRVPSYASSLTDWCYNVNPKEIAYFPRITYPQAQICIGEDYDHYAVLSTLPTNPYGWTSWCQVPNDTVSPSTFPPAWDGTLYDFYHYLDTNVPGNNDFMPQSGMPYFDDRHGVVGVLNADNTISFWIVAKPGTYLQGQYVTTHPTAITEICKLTLANIEQFLDPDTDPAPEPGFEADVTKPGGGNNTPSYNQYPNDDISFPGLPTNNFLASGLCGLYNPTAGAVTSLANWLWTDSFLTAAKRAFTTQPLDAIVFLGMLPFQPSGSPSTIQAAGIDSGISANRITTQYYTLDFGIIHIPEKWSSIMDYKYTNISIHLPFIGIRDLDTEACMDATLYLKYYVDCVSGDAVAMLECIKVGNSASVLYTWECNMMTRLPLTGADRSAMVASAMKGAGAIAAMGAAMMFPPATMAAAAATTLGVGTALASSAANMNKANIKQSGQFTGNSGMLGQFTAYIIVDHPRQSLPANFGHQVGFTANYTATLSSLSGFTQMQSIHLNIQATNEELDEIERYLKEGVIL